MAKREIAPTVQATIQSRVREGETGGLALILWLASGNEIISPWWSTHRDRQLRTFWRQVDYLSGAIYTIASRLATIPFHVIPRDMSISAHQDQAEKFQLLLEEGSEFGDGWETWFSKWNEDLVTQDNGAFSEIIGEGDPSGPIQGMPLGIAHLDSARCMRTSKPEYPVIYTDTDGERYKLHHTRVVYASLQPSTMAEMYNVGFCSVSRCINIAQNLLDILVYKQEKLGSRPHRNILITQGGLDPEVVQSAFGLAEESMDNQRLTRYSKSVVIGDANIPAADMKTIELSALPEGFDEQTSITLGMATIALAFGVDARELFPAMGIGATRADALIQHLKARGKGIGHLLQIAENKLSQKFLPPQLQLIFDFQDDAQDKQVADIKLIRAQRHEISVNTGFIDLRTVHEQMLSDGDITDAQFEQMELDSGRLVDGTNILSLFYNPEHKKILSMGVPDPLDVEANDPNAMLIIIDEKRREILQGLGVITNHNQRRLLNESLAAISALKNEYEATRPPPIPTEGEEEPEEPEGEVETIDEGEAETEMEETEVGTTEGPFEFKQRGAERFAKSVRDNVRGLWGGHWDVIVFMSNMMELLDWGYEDAWTEGAATCGLLREDRTVEETSRIMQESRQDQGYILAFADYIVLNSKANGGKLGTCLTRAKIWTNRYNAVKTLAQSIACADRKFIWNLGPTKVHCDDCLSYAGRVHRGSVWRSVGAQPQSRSLACGGWNCLCVLQPTDAPATPGRPRRPSGG